MADFCEPEDRFPGAVAVWCSGVIGRSSSYEHGWEAECALGPPRIFPAYGDIRGSWAPLQPRGTEEWIELLLEIPLFVLRVDVFETFNPGHTTSLSVSSAVQRGRAAANDWKVLWHESVEERRAAGTMPVAFSRVFSPPHAPSSFRVAALRLEFDCTQAASWVEVDAVRAIGVPAPSLPWTPALASLMPRSFLRAIRTLLLCLFRADIHPGPFTLQDVVDAAWSVWEQTREDTLDRELARARLRCGYSARVGGWICRGRRNGCSGGPVFGSGIYSCGSNICSAAVHSGVIADPEDGGVCATHGSSAMPTPGSIGCHGIESGASRLGTGFVCGEVESRLLGMPPCGRKGSVWYCHGRERGCTGGPVWGGPQLYRNDSNICAAALHSGAIGLRGGVFLVVQCGSDLVLDQAAFPGLAQNGVSSLPFDSACQASGCFAVVPVILPHPAPIGSV